MVLTQKVRLSVFLVMAIFIAVPGMLVAFQEPSVPSDPEVDPDVLVAFYPKDGEDGGRFEAEVSPGETVELTALIINYHEDPVDLRKYTSNVVPRMNGGLQMAAIDAEPSGTTLWLDFPTEDFTLQGGESIERPLVVSVPEGTPPGQYVNAVAVTTVNPANPGETGAFEIFYSKIVSVYITVPGEIQAEFLVGTPEIIVDGPRAAIQFPIENTGNIRIDLTGRVTLIDPNGSTIFDSEFFVSPIYSGQSTGIQLRLGNVPQAGEYKVNYSFIDENHDVTKVAESVDLTAPEPDLAAEAPIRFESVSVESNADPIVFANVSVDVASVQQTYRSTRLTLSVYHDGELVEDFVLAENLSISRGTASVTQRYLPATNWETGTYTFSLKLESTDGDQTSLILEAEDVASLEVP